MLSNEKERDMTLFERLADEYKIDRRDLTLAFTFLRQFAGHITGAAVDPRAKVVALSFQLETDRIHSAKRIPPHEFRNLVDVGRRLARDLARTS